MTLLTKHSFRESMKRREEVVKRQAHENPLKVDSFRTSLQLYVASINFRVCTREKFEFQSHIFERLHKGKEGSDETFVSPLFLPRHRHSIHSVNRDLSAFCDI